MKIPGYIFTCPSIHGSLKTWTIKDSVEVIATPLLLKKLVGNKNPKLSEKFLSHFQLIRSFSYIKT